MALLWAVAGEPVPALRALIGRLLPYFSSCARYGASRRHSG